MKICALSETETIKYALDEFVKYLNLVDETIEVKIVSSDADIAFGLLSDLGLRADDVSDPVYDDVVDVKIDGMRGYIAGSNERSVLFGVYNFFKSVGCMWVRPGIKGEYIPKRSLAGYSFAMRKRADQPFRGQCIEGAVSFENVRDTIEWLPKVNANLFMIQQIVPYNIISRWYFHDASTTKEPEDVSYEDIAEYTIKLEHFIRKCGLQLHDVGHGYLLEPYGIHYKTFFDEYELSDEAREDVALIGGKRELFDGSPNFTQLCFSKDKARLGLVKFLAEYLEGKPYIDFLHVWLSDSVNNHCECENCRKKRPADFYVRMLNELDEELTKKGIDTKIVFIMYTDTFWPPESTSFNSPDRFILTTAAGGRNRAVPYTSKRSTEPIPDFVRNQYKLKSSFELTMSFVDEWRKIFDGPKFLFEYHMYTDHLFDPGYMNISRSVFEDCKHVGDAEFSGIMCCQTQRVYFPTGLPSAIMGEALFDESLDFDSYVDDYFKASFGDGYRAAREYLERISAIFNSNSLRVNDTIVEEDATTGKVIRRTAIRNNPATAERLSALAREVDSFLPTIAKNMDLADECHRESYRILHYHAEYCKHLAEVLIAFAHDDIDLTAELFDDLIDYLSQIEDEIQPYLDIFLVNKRWRQIIDPSWNMFKMIPKNLQKK